MQPNPALSALKPADTIADATIDDGWERPMTDWAALSFNTPLNIQMSADMFAHIQHHATIRAETEEQFVGNGLMWWVSECEMADDYMRQEAEDPERVAAESTSNEEMCKELGIVPYAIRRNWEANLDDVDDRY